MAMTHKPGPARAMSIVGNEYPPELFPDFPDAVKERFPELEQWRSTAEANYQKFVDVLMRRDNEANSAIEAVRDEIP